MKNIRVGTKTQTGFGRSYRDHPKRYSLGGGEESKSLPAGSLPTANYQKSEMTSTRLITDQGDCRST